MAQSSVIIHIFNLFVQFQLECLTWKWFIGEVKVIGGGLLFDSFNLVQVHVSMQLLSGHSQFPGWPYHCMFTPLME